MRSKSAELKKEIFDFVNDYKREYNTSPTLRVIGDAVGVSYNTVHRYLVEMRDRDHSVDYDGENIETKYLNAENSSLAEALLVGSIPCGEAQDEEEHIEAYLNLPTAIFGKGSFYLLRASGDSMEDAGIHEGDLVVIKKNVEASEGDIVVALDDESQNTLKRYGGSNGRYATLEYMNEAVYPGKVIKVRELTIQGVAQFVIKSL